MHVWTYFGLQLWLHASSLCFSLLELFFFFLKNMITASPVPLLHADTLLSGWMGWCRACWTWRQIRCRGWVWRWCWGRGQSGWCPYRTQSTPWSIIPWGRCMGEGNAARLKTHKHTHIHHALLHRRSILVENHHHDMCWLRVDIVWQPICLLRYCTYTRYYDKSTVDFRFATVEWLFDKTGFCFRAAKKKEKKSICSTSRLRIKQISHPVAGLYFARRTLSLSISQLLVYMATAETDILLDLNNNDNAAQHITGSRLMNGNNTLQAL